MTRQCVLGRCGSRPGLGPAGRALWVLTTLLVVVTFGAGAADESTPNNTSWRSAALQVSRDLTSRATVDSTGYRWPIVYKDETTGQTSTSYPATVYEGSAGIVVFLADLYRATGDAGVKKAAEEGGRWLGSHAAAETVYGNNLYFGWGGIAWAYCELYEATGNSTWLKQAESIASRMATTNSSWLDLIDGAPGEGLFYLKLYGETGDSRWLTAAKRRGNWLLNHGVAVGNGLKWPVGLSQEWSSIYYPGMLTAPPVSVTFWLSCLVCPPRRMRRAILEARERRQRT